MLKGMLTLLGFVLDTLCKSYHLLLREQPSEEGISIIATFYWWKSLRLGDDK